VIAFFLLLSAIPFNHGDHIRQLGLMAVVSLYAPVTKGYNICDRFNIPSMWYPIGGSTFITAAKLKYRWHYCNKSLQNPSRPRRQLTTSAAVITVGVCKKPVANCHFLAIRHRLQKTVTTEAIAP
jgi:hypothetical protein